MCDPSHQTLKKVKLRPCIKSTVFFVIETEFTARYEMLKIIQVKFSLQPPRTVNLLAPELFFLILAHTVYKM